MDTLDPFTIVAEPSRRSLLDALQSGAKSVSHLVTDTGLSQPVVSKHLRILKDAQFVTVTPQGQQRIYALNLEAFLAMEHWLRPYREMWSARLDNLESFLNQD